MTLSANKTDRLSITVDSKGSKDAIIDLLETTIEGLKADDGKKFKLNLKLKELVS